MEKFESIILKGKISLVEVSNGLFIYLVYIFMIGACIWGIYSINYQPAPLPAQNETDFYTSSTNFVLSIGFVVLLIFLLYIFYKQIISVKTSFFEDKRTIELKKKAVEKIINTNKWKIVGLILIIIFFMKIIYSCDLIISL